MAHPRARLGPLHVLRDPWATDLPWVATGPKSEEGYRGATTQAHGVRSDKSASPWRASSAPSRFDRFASLVGVAGHAYDSWEIGMNIALLRATTISAVVLLGCSISTDAAEVRVLLEGAVLGAYQQIAPQFERASGHKLIPQFDFGPNLINKIDAGEPFDAIFLVGDFEPLVMRKKVSAGSQVLGRIGVGYAIPQGTPKPAISSAEAVKRTLLDAKAIATSGPGASGRYVLTLLDRLGIADQVTPKIRPAPGGLAAQLVARHEVDFAVIGLPPVVGKPGVEWIGYLPEELQNWLLFTGGISATAEEAEAAGELLRFFSTPVAVAVLK